MIYSLGVKRVWCVFSEAKVVSCVCLLCFLQVRVLTIVFPCFVCLQADRGRPWSGTGRDLSLGLVTTKKRQIPGHPPTPGTSALLSVQMLLLPLLLLREGRLRGTWNLPPSEVPPGHPTLHTRPYHLTPPHSTHSTPVHVFIEKSRVFGVRWVMWMRPRVG